MMLTHTKQETIEIINGPAGKLELAVGKALTVERNAWGIVCHPHPLHGGSMQNKVVTTLVKTFQECGVATVRFNFRGVGQSEGQFDNARGEYDDLIAVINWVQQQKTKDEIWLAGFSFGAYIAAKAATDLPVAKLVTVAPPVEHFPMQTLPSITSKWILVQGDRDTVVPADKVLAWAESREPQPIILRFPEAGHFFHGVLGELRTRLEEVLNS